MGYPVNRRPVMKLHRPPAPAGSVHPLREYEYVDEETELTLEIIDAARRAGIRHDEIPVPRHPKPDPPQNVIIKGTGWMGPG